MRFFSEIAPSKTSGCSWARAAYVAADHPAGPLPMMTTVSAAVAERESAMTTGSWSGRARAVVPVDDAPANGHDGGGRIAAEGPLDVSRAGPR
jgi:hypothetical protein